MSPENLKTEKDAERMLCHVDHAYTCEGSACMAWCWAGWRTKNGKVKARIPEGERFGERLGYCGLVHERKP